MKKTIKVNSIETLKLRLDTRASSEGKKAAPSLVAAAKGFTVV